MNATRADHTRATLWMRTLSTLQVPWRATRLCAPSLASAFPVRLVIYHIILLCLVPALLRPTRRYHLGATSLGRQRATSRFSNITPLDHTPTHTHTCTLFFALSLAYTHTHRADVAVFTPKMYANLGVSWAGTVVGFIALIFIPAPILFYKYGKRIRMSSRYAREADAVARRMAEKFQREKMLGTPSASAGGATRRNSVQDLPLETADDLVRSASLSEAKLRGNHSQVDVEKAAAAADVRASDRRQMPQQELEEERDVASIRDVRVGGEADAMALPAVQQARAGTADELRYERR